MLMGTDMKKNFYITTALPYVNSSPHIGHALEFVRADVIARYKKSLGFNVFFNTGTDEHGKKIYDAAQSEGMDTQKYVDGNAKKFKDLLTTLDIDSDVHFIRTTAAHHIKGAQALWEKVNTNGFIYKSRYQTKYCVGCELEKTDSELIDGCCKDHPSLVIEEVDEENYFFKFSAFQKKLSELYKSRPDFVLPESKMNEIRSFVSSGLRDFSISRLKTKMPWGVPVPGDEDQVMYVWFDALANYITTLGWPEDDAQFNDFWAHGTPTQYCGQDNLRQQSAMWQAILLAADLPTSYQIVVNGFVVGAGGIKMSKTLGNVIDPLQLIEHYGTDAFRYYVLQHIHPWDGSPVTHESFHQAYISDLVNGIGNLTARTLTMSEKYLDKPVAVPEVECPKEWHDLLSGFRIDLACESIRKHVAELDRSINNDEAFKIAKTDMKKAQKLVTEYVKKLALIAKMLEPLLPHTSEVIKKHISTNKKPASLFERKEGIS